MVKVICSFCAASVQPDWCSTNIGLLVMEAGVHRLS